MFYNLQHKTACNLETKEKNYMHALIWLLDHLDFKEEQTMCTHIYIIYVMVDQNGSQSEKLLMQN